jgi:hypothetical protein
MSLQINNLHDYVSAVTGLLGRWALMGALVEFSTRMGAGFARD